MALKKKREVPPRPGRPESGKDSAAAQSRGRGQRPLLELSIPNYTESGPEEIRAGIFYSDGGWVVKSLSGDELSIEGKKLREKKLEADDRMQFGPVMVRFHSPRVGRETGAPHERPAPVSFMKRVEALIEEAKALARPAAFMEFYRKDKKKAIMAGAGAAALLLLTLGLLISALTGGNAEADLHARPTLESLLSTGIDNFMHEEFDHAFAYFKRAKAEYPERREAEILFRIARMFGQDADLFHFDWDETISLFEELAAVPGASDTVRQFAVERADYLKRESQCAQMIFVAMTHIEKKDYESALAQYQKLQREFPNSDLLPLVHSDILELRLTMRKEYLSKAEEVLAAGDPDWNRALAFLKKAAECYGEQDKSVDEKIAYCQLNSSVREILTRAQALYSNGKYGDALKTLSTAEPGSVYERQIEALGILVTDEQNLIEAQRLYDDKRADEALEVLARLDRQKSGTLKQRISTVLTNYNKGEAFFNDRMYLKCLPYLRKVVEAETNPKNLYSRDAANLLENALEMIKNQAYRSYEAGVYALGNMQYEKALEEFSTCIENDLDKEFQRKISEKVTLEAKKIVDRAQTHAWGKQLTEEDYYALRLVEKYVAEDNPLRAQAIELLKKIQK